jgi:hypothetical protein
MQSSKDTHCGRSVEATDVSPGELSPYDSPHVDFIKRSSSSGVIPRSAKTCSCGIGSLCFCHSLASFRAFSSLGSRGSLSIGALAIAREIGLSIISSNPTTAEACLGSKLLDQFVRSSFFVLAISSHENLLRVPCHFQHFTRYRGAHRSISDQARSKISPGLIFPVARFAINCRFAAKKSYAPNSFGSTQAICSKQSGLASPSAVAAA